jgi:hypothetical protein
VLHVEPEVLIEEVKGSHPPRCLTQRARQSFELRQVDERANLTIGVDGGDLVVVVVVVVVAAAVVVVGDGGGGGWWRDCERAVQR